MMVFMQVHDGPESAPVLAAPTLVILFGSCESMHQRHALLY